MVGKNEDFADIDEESLERVRLIAEKTRQLEKTAQQVRQEIRSSFDRLCETLRARERQLLRQVEAVHRQQLSLVQSNSELLPASASLSAVLDAELELAVKLLGFGRIALSNSIAVSDSEPYRAEEYQEAAEDFVSYDKSLKSEADEFDANSVIRRKLDGSGQPAKINLNCTSCDSCKFETDLAPAVAATTKKLANTPETPESSSGSDVSPIKEKIKEESSTSSESRSPTTIEKTPTSENLNTEETTLSGTDCTTKTTHEQDENDASKSTEDCATVKAQEKIKDGGTEHPVQIQQWLQQILAETETEPIIHEIGQFTKIPNTRLYREFPVET